MRSGSHFRLQIGPHIEPVQLNLSTCVSTLGSVDWKLVNKTSGALIASDTTCASKLVAAVPAGSYQLRVTRNGSKGTYKLAIKKV